MSKSTKIIAAFGVVAGLGVAALPLGAYAADDTTAEVTYQATIDQTLSLTSDISTATITKLTNNGGSTAGTDTKLTAITNNTTGYTITVKDNDTDTSLKTTAGDSIAYGTPGAATSAWSLTVDGESTALALSGTTAATVATSDSETAAEGAVTTVKYAASASATQAAGTYTDTVTYTVVANS